MPIWKDLRFALRQLRRSPGFAAVVLATLGLAIGANTAVYSVLDAVLFRGVPYPEPDRLAALRATRIFQGRVSDSDQTGRQFLLVRDAAPGLDAAAFSDEQGVNFAAGNRPEYVQQQRVSAGFFHAIGVAPQFGREFTRAEDVPGGPALAVLSHRFWERVFHGDPHAIGRTITLRGEPYTVIGVMPRDFQAAAQIDVWTPLHPTVDGEGGGSNYGAIARLKPGVSQAEAEGQLAAISHVIEEMRATNGSDKAGFEERLVPYQTSLTADVRTQLLLTWGAVLAVLLIGCVNIAGLLLARARERSREIATRLAVGGSRAQIVRQLLAESLVLSLAGCVVGIAAGSFAIDGLKRMGAAQFELWHPIELDWRVAMAMLALAVGTSIIFGLAPAIASSRLDIRSVLVEGGRGVAGRRTHWTRGALVAGEVALSLVLLVAAGLLVRTVAYLHDVRPGFDARNVMAAEASLQDKRYETSAAVGRLFRESLDAIRRIPGVESAAVALSLPYERPLNSGFRIIDGRNERGEIADWVYATPGYFAAMRIPILRGREFRESDDAQAAKVLVVSQSFSARYFPEGGAIGHHMVCGRNDTCEIVGIAGDVRQHSGITGDDGPLSIEPTIYFPAAQTTDGFVKLAHTWISPKWVIRTGGPVRGLEGRVQSAIASVDPMLPVAHFRTMDELRGRYTNQQQYLAMLFSVLAGLAVLLAAIGLYALIGRGIVERQHEIGVRLALGATARHAMVEVMRPGLLLSGAGIVAGAAISMATVRMLKSLIWGVQPTDVANFLVTAGILLVVTVAASLVPALRILRLDPAETLRSE